MQNLCQKTVIHIFKKIKFWSRDGLSHASGVGLKNQITLRDDALIVFRRQNHVTFIFIKTMPQVQVAYWKEEA